MVLWSFTAQPGVRSNVIDSARASQIQPDSVFGLDAILRLLCGLNLHL